MPTTTTLTPTADFLNTGWLDFDEDGQIWDELADSSDASYIWNPPLASGNGVVEFGTFTIGAGDRVRYVQPLIRASCTEVLGLPISYRAVGANSSIVTAQQNATVATGGSHASPQDITGGAIPLAPNTGARWEQADIDALRIGLIVQNLTSEDRLRVQRLRADVVTSDQPTVSADAPTGTVTDEPQPTVEWTGTADDPITSNLVRVFSSAQYGAGGFDPELSTATWETTISGDPGQVQIGEALTPGTYRAYVWVNAPMLGDWWSAVDFVQFDVSYTPPNAPTLACTGQDDDSRIRLVVTPSGSGAAPERIQIERSTEGSSGPFELVRDGDRDYAGVGTITWYDADAGNGQQVWYRARSIDTGLGVDNPSAWSAVSTCTWTRALDGGCLWDLKSLARPSLNRTVTIAEGGFPTESYPVRQGVHYVLDRDLPVPVSSWIFGPRGEFVLAVCDLTELDAVILLIRRGGILALQSDPDDTWGPRYVAVESLDVERPPLNIAAWRVVRVGYVEVDSPADLVDPDYTFVP